MYSDVSPSSAKLVSVEWLDITGSGHDPGLTRRWSVGYLLSTTMISEGAPCVVLGTTWDEDGWSDFSTFPVSIVLTMEEV